MPGMRLDISQRQKQIQTLKMNPRMIQTIAILSMPTMELREYIFKEAEKNPALEVIHDRTQETPPESAPHNTSAHISESSTGNSAESDAFQAFIESRPARTKTLQVHLLEQLVLLPLGETERALSEKIIGNLDTHGFFLSPPETLLDSKNSLETPALLKKCLDIVRRLDPAGTACVDVYESLFVQAELAGAVPPLVLFFLDGRLEILDSTKPQSVLKKITTLIKEDPDAESKYGLPSKCTVQDVEAALDFIRRLDPFPARSFDTEQTVYISPDVYVTKVFADDEDAPREAQFQVTFARNTLPAISLSPAFSQLAADKKKTKDEASGFAKLYVQEAQWFLTSVLQREQSIVKAAEAIVKAQIQFFEKGPRYLLPLRMKDIAEVIDVHEATISRIANGKYLQCEWGLFEIRYFFSNQVSSTTLMLKSKESVKQELLAILRDYEEQKKKYPGLKKLTDEDLVAKLKERGITIARRTVAKYRAELNINSSFGR
jgi:RNA polymerase sigma-54 factor